MEPALERYTLLRARIEFEYTLINQRVTWLVTSQSFLFTGYAISLNYAAGAESAFQTRQHHLLLRVIPITAIVLCLVVYATLAAAMHAIHVLVSRGRDIAQAVPGEEWIGLVASPWVYRAGISAAVLIPALFLIVWTMLLVSQ